MLNGVNLPYNRIRLEGLNPDVLYHNSLDGNDHYGDELMNLGLILTDAMSGQAASAEEASMDFDSKIFLLEANSEEDIKI